jgi:4-diphosphocytidyl-2-C-methyl-D-erythritol kinase
VNLTLDVFPPRPDGYHDLDSVVYFFHPADELTITTVPGPPHVHLTCSDPSLPTDDGNLAYRTAQLYLDRLSPGADFGIHIALEKRLPHQAGLGGGSSDAAAVLCALTRCLGEPTVEAAATLGSDVPLFLYRTPLRMQGRGEVITTLGVEYPSVPDLYGVIVKPAVGVPTGPAYRLLDSLPDRQPGSATPHLLDALVQGDIVAIGAAMGNDFEAAIQPAYPEVAAAHQAVTEAGAVRALLCGSGSAIFGLARDRDHARVLTDALRGRFPFVETAEPYEPN